MKNEFKQHHSKLVREGIIKALVCGAIIGFSLSLIAAIVSFLLIYNGLWISIGVGLGATAIAAPLFYYIGFRPVLKNVAERIDRMGLDERIITMMELENDDSYIAKLQREDAQEKLSRIKRNQLKISIFKIPVIALAIIAVFSISMITMSALSAQGLLPFSLLGLGQNEETYVEVYYEAALGGFIEGDPVQIILYGQSTSVVTAVADDGWLFKEWDLDGYDKAERSDSNVQENMTITAIFEIIMGEEPGDEPTDRPGPEEDSDNPHPDAPPTPNPQPDEVGEDTNEGGYEYHDNNQIKNGEIHYSKEYETYYNLAMDILKNGGEIPPSLLKMINKYYTIIDTDGLSEPN